MIGIYKFTNKINNKSYIGQSVNINRRYKEHKNIYRENTIFHDALIEFGFSNFIFTIVEECKINELNDKEIYYIKKYNTLFPNGYNVSSGGSNGAHPNKIKHIKDIDEIINLLKTTNMSNLDIGKLYGVSDQTISDINCGRIWFNKDIKYPIRKKNILLPRFCEECGCKLYKYSNSNLCKKCFNKSAKTIPPVSKDELFELLCNNSFVKVGKMYNVTDNAVRKWCDKYNIPIKSNYYKNINNNF